MFTSLNFKMINSIGVPVSVELNVAGGIVSYCISYSKKGKSKQKQERLSQRNSANLLKRIDQMKLVTALCKYQAFDLNEGGSFWAIHIDHIMGTTDLSGPSPRESHSVIVPLIDDFAQLLDETFRITQFISPTRLDRLEIELMAPDADLDENDSEEVVRVCTHQEILALDRKTNTIEYARQFPSRCFNGHFGCRCDEEVRRLLDKVEDLFTEDYLFEDIDSDEDSNPRLRFTFAFHDGSSAHVSRILSIGGLRDELYMELLDEIFENVLRLMFKAGLFDKRLVMSDRGLKDLPFFIIYSEDGVHNLQGDLEQFQENIEQDLGDMPEDEDFTDGKVYRVL